MKNKQQFNCEIIVKETEKYDYTFKVIIIGDPSVGKTSLTIMAMKNQYRELNATIGFDYDCLKIKINNLVIQLEIWDTCGFDKYRCLHTNFYRNASLAIVVYSIDDDKSFESINKWIEVVKILSLPNAKIILVGNKNDLEINRLIPKEFGEAFAFEQKLYFFEASSKTGYNARNIFFEAAKVLLEEQLRKELVKNKDRDTSNMLKSIIINKETKQQQNKGCC